MQRAGLAPDNGGSGSGAAGASGGAGAARLLRAPCSLVDRTITPRAKMQFPGA
jgi:hypothetical protein